MVDFSYKKEGNLISLTIRTDSTEIGTLFRIIACLYVLKMDILSGEVQTLEENGKSYTYDRFLVKSLSPENDSAFELGVLMDSLFTRYEDIHKILKSYDLRDPDPQIFFEGNFEFIFMDDPQTSTTCFYMESRNARGLLYHVTRILMKNKIDIVSAKIETDSVANLAMDRFYIRDENGQPLSRNPELIETIKTEILKKTEKSPGDTGQDTIPYKEL